MPPRPGPAPGPRRVRRLRAWAPGAPPTEMPAGTGIRLAAERKLVLQVHYYTDEGTVPDQTAVKLRLEDAAPA